MLQLQRRRALRRLRRPRSPAAAGEPLQLEAEAVAGAAKQRRAALSDDQSGHWPAAPGDGLLEQLAHGAGDVLHKYCME